MRVVFALMLLFLFSDVEAQTSNLKKVEGVMFIKLGKDTTGVQQFRLNGDSIYTLVYRRPSGLLVFKGEGTIFPDGTLKSMQSIIYSIGSNGEKEKFGENRLYTTSDSTFIDIKSSDRKVFRSYAGHCFSANDMDFTTFYVFPYLVYFAPKNVNDSIVGNQFVLGQSRKYSMKRISMDKITVGSSIMGTLTLQVDSRGDLKAIDGIGSSLNLTGTVERKFNIDSLFNAWVKYEQTNGAMGAQLVRDTSKAILNSGSAEIDYWRPYMRGRKIFGAVVPWNRFWRTGANHATQLRISKPIYFYDQRLDTGRYSIFTMPTERGWTMMINKQAAIWGTDYNPDYDVLRVPMKIGKTATSIEQLSIKILATGNKGTIQIEWENTRASIDFEMRDQ